MAILDKEINKEFNEWVHSDEVIADGKGYFKTQCAQWKNNCNLLELELYFIREYHNEYWHSITHPEAE